MYLYKAFSFNISSELEIPEFLPGEGVPDITILMGKVSDKLNNPTAKGLRYQIADGEFLLKVDNIARYYVEQGKKITIDPDIMATANDIRLFLLGSVFGALFHQRKLLPFHASSICYEGKAILFTGPTGIGKSTLAAAFRLKGFQTVSDDISLVVPDSIDGYTLVPGYPQVKLWEKSLKLLNQDCTGMEKIREKLNKYKLDVKSNFYGTESLKIKTIYLIATKRTEGTEITDLKGAEKFIELKDNIFRSKWVNDFKNQQVNFSLLSFLIQSCQIRKISRQKDIDCLDELVNLIMEDQQHG